MSPNKKIKIGSDFSGVGAFNQALKRLNIDYDEVFACDMDKYARQTFIHNYGVPKYYPTNVYDREIPKEPLDIFMTSPPCQAFSLAGKRKGEEDKRGVLFYNSHEFIQQNKPRYFIFENVKGLLSDDKGKTFQRWCDFLGGKTINGNPTIFPHEEAVPYHIYYQVLNAKHYGVPQNRERIFIIGIRDDEDNNFNFPKPFPLEKRLKDVLEDNVDEKYYLSEKMIEGFISNQNNNQIGFINQDTQASKVFSQESISQTLCAGTHGYANGYIEVKSATTKGYEVAEIGEDSINLEHPNSETRRGRVGKSVPQTLTTSCNQGVAINIIANLPGKHEQNSRVYGIDGISPTLTTMQGGGQEPKVAIGAIRGRNIDNPKSRESGLPTTQMLEINENGTSNCLTTVQKDNVMVEYKDKRLNKFLKENQLKPLELIDTYNQTSNTEITHTITCRVNASNNTFLNKNYRIRKLTPRECFRLMDFPEDFDFSVVSDSQAYKQAGNSIVVNVLSQIISKLNL